MIKWIILLLWSSIAFGAEYEVITPKISFKTKKVIEILGPISEATAESYQKQMLETLGIKGPRLVIIDSNGGTQSDGQEIIAMIHQEQLQGTRVTCVVRHWAFSMAFNILSQCDTRLATEKAKFMFHKLAVTRITGPGDSEYDSDPNTNNLRLTAKRLRQIADNLDFDDQYYHDLSRKLLGMSYADYEIHADNSTTWTAIPLLAKKYLHQIVELKKLP